MSATIESFGTTASVVGSPVTLASPTTNHIRAIGVDVTNLAAGEIVQITALALAKFGGSSIVVEQQSFTGVAAKAHEQISPVLMPYGGSFTITQSNGSARNFDWYVMVLDP